ncbi:hypothetical protein HID58_042761, partial [Brassica napus]
MPNKKYISRLCNLTKQIDVGSIHATVNRIWTAPKAGSKIDVQFIAKNTVLFRIENDQMRNRGKEVEGSRDIGVKDDKIRGGDETGIVEAVETMPKEGNAMEHLIKDLEELSPVASSHEEKTSKISETSKELSKTIDVWVNGKGVKASGDVNGEKEFTISPSRFSPLQDIDEEEETCLEGSGTEVEEVEFRGNIVDGKKEKELQVASTSRQQGSVPRQLRGRVTGSKDMTLIDTTPGNFARAAEAANRWNTLARVEEKFYKQKSCIRWLSVGDQNTKVFHSMVQTRNAKNTIRRLVTIEGEVLTSLPDIKKEAVSYFQSFLQGQDPNSEVISVTALQDLLTYRCPGDHSAA